MAIEVIGKDESLKERITCTNCASILEYLPLDVHKDTVWGYGGDRDVVKYIVCPCCTINVYLS